jgi:hypothetical protein
MIQWAVTGRHRTELPQVWERPIYRGFRYWAALGKMALIEYPERLKRSSASRAAWVQSTLIAGFRAVATMEPTKTAGIRDSSALLAIEATPVGSQRRASPWPGTSRFALQQKSRPLAPIPASCGGASTHARASEPCASARIRLCRPAIEE